MPGNGNGININVTATISGYEASLQKFRDALKKINPGADVGKSITAALNDAEKKVKSFQIQVK